MYNENINKKKGLLRFIAIAIALLLLGSGGVMQIAVAAVDGMLRATPVPTVSVGSVSYNSSRAAVTINLTNAEANVEYTVYYRTANGSAIAGKQFQQREGTVTLSSRKTSETVYVQYVKESADLYGIGSFVANNGTTYSGTKHFIFEIYYAESNGDTVYQSGSVNTDGTVSINSSASNKKINTYAPTNNLGVGYSDGIAYLSGSLWSEDGDVKWTEEASSYHESGDKIPNYAFRYKLQFMTSNSSGESTSSNVIFGYYQIPEKYRGYYDGKATSYVSGSFKVKISSSTTGSISTAIYNAAIYTTDFTTEDGDMDLAIYTLGKKGEKTGISCSTWRSNYTSKYGDMMKEFFGSGENYKAGLNGRNAICIARDAAFIYFYKSYAVGVMQITSAKMSYMYYDDTPPEITGYYVQNGTYGAGQTVRLSVTFNELVRLRNYNTTPYIVVTGSGTSGRLEFKYAGGDGTDTLYFEAVVPSGGSSSNINITNLKDCNFNLYNFVNVVDMSYNATGYPGATVKSNSNSNMVTSKFTIDDYGKATALTVDNRTAGFSVNSITEIDASGNTSNYTYRANPSSSVYGVRVVLNLSNIKNGAYVYYTWVSGYNNTDYISKSDYQTVTASSNTATISTTELLSGKYSLRILYVSPTFVKTTATYNFYFDTSSPEVTLSAPTGYNIFTSGTHDFEIQATDDSLTRITKVEYALSRSASETENTLDAAGLFITIDRSSATEVSETVTVGKDRRGDVTKGIDESVAGKYYVYARVTDGNGAKILTRSAFTLAFDFRSADQVSDSFQWTLTGGGTAENDTMLQGTLTAELGNVFFQKASFQWLCDDTTTWNLTLKHNGETLFTETIANRDDVDKLSGYMEMSEDNYNLKFEKNGYYEMQLSYTGSDGASFEFYRDVYIYGVDGIYGGSNYDTLMGEYRYVKTKYWQFLRSSYYRRDDSNNVRNIFFITGTDSALPVFPDYQSAYDYVRLLEVQDIAQKILTQTDVSTIHSGGQLRGDDVEPREGDIWYYYKSSGGGTDINGYRWYYYGIEDAGSNLSQALHKNILRIVGSQTDPDYPNDYRYATYDKILNSDSGNIFMSIDKTLNNPQMYVSTLEIDSETAILASGYTVNSEIGTRLFARPYHSDVSYNEVIDTIGDSLVTGVYEMVEIGPKGAIKFLVYIDNTAPYIDLEITNGQDETISYQDITGTASATIYGKKLVISAMKGELDTWSVICISKANGATVSMTIAEFVERGVYEITESGTYTIYAFDRSGNVTMFTAMLKADDIALTAPTNANARSYGFAITNRVRSEIATFTIMYNGVVQTVDANGESLTQLRQLSFTFGYSGTYRIDVTDRYGYVLSKEFELEKSLPTFTLMVDLEGNGQYVNCTELPGFVQVSDDGATYTVFTSSALRILYTDKSYNFTWLMEPEEGTYKYGGFVGTSYRHSLTKEAKDWICVLGYDGDPYSSITIISLADDTSPSVSAEAVKGGNSTGIANNSETAADTVTVSWNDPDSPVTVATYTFNGGAPVVLDASAGSVTLPVTNGEGVYVFTVTNIVGLSQTLTFTIDNTIDMTVTSTDKAINPKDGNVIYDNENIMLVLKEAIDFYISCNHYPLISGEPFQIYLSYSGNGSISAMFLVEGNEDPDALEISAEFLATLKNGSVAGLTDDPNLTDSIALLRENFITLGRTEEGSLYVGLDAPDSESDERLYSIQLNERGLEASIELRLCKQASDIIVIDEENRELVFKPGGIISVNYDISLLGQLQTLGIISKISYVANVQGEEVIVYNGEDSIFNDTTFTEDGEYVITVSNHYGNTTVKTIRIYRQIQLDIEVGYADGTTIKVDNGEIVSNGSVTFSGTAGTEYTLQTDDGADLPASFVFTLDTDGENYVLTISQPGEYRFTVTDTFGNTLSYVVTIVVPEEKKTNDKNSLLSDWKIGALRGDENYTSEKLSFVEGMNTAYVVYTYYAGLSLDDPVALDEATGKTVIVRNLLNREQINLYDSLKIGDDGDGLYIISFYDGSGNRILLNEQDTVIVSYKGTPQFTLSRVVEGSAEEPYDINKALESGFWSNGRLLFAITAKEYSFTVNGEVVTLDESGKYVIVRGTDETEAVYEITYADDYGNAYTFTANIFKASPQIYYTDDSMVITLNSIAYVKGSPTFTSNANGVRAYYVKDAGGEVSYTPGESITGDGSYVLTFIDIAGNENAVRFTIDTKVDWRITVGKTGSETELFNGVASNKVIKLSRSASEAVVVVSAMRDGTDIMSLFQNVSSAYTFEEDGLYELTVADQVGNTDTITFTIVAAPRQTFIYETPEGWFVNALSYLSGGVNVYVNDTEFISVNNEKVTLSGDRVWTVNMTERNTGETYSFEVTADNTAPTASFTGLSENTKGTVTLTDVDSNGVAEIYHNGKRVSFANTAAGKKLSLSVSEPGEYLVVITDTAGNITEYTFTVAYSLNGFSIVMIVLAGLFVFALLFVLIRMRRTMRVR